MTDSSAATAGPAASDIPDYPMPRSGKCPFDPPAALRDLQAEAPLMRTRLWDGSTPWIVTRYDVLRSLFADPRISADLSHPNYPHMTEAFKERRDKDRTFLTMDDPEHARQRRMVTRPFTIKRVEAMRPAIQKIVDDRLDHILNGPKPADLVETFALPVPSLVICELLGVPYEKHDFFQVNSKTLINRNTTPEQGLAAEKALVDYLDELIGEKLARPGDDLLSELAGRMKAGELTRREAAVMGKTLLIAGHETSANMIALGTLALLEHPDQLAILRDADDPAVLANTVEELLRYLTIVHSARRRVALEDIEIAGQVIHAGEALLLSDDIANRDAAAFPRPDELDIRRPEARRHVAFGYGPHQCLGQPLARVELQIAYRTLFQRMPNMRLAVGLDELPFKHDGLVYGVYRLPITW